MARGAASKSRATKANNEDTKLRLVMKPMYNLLTKFCYV
jgi:hypothetical protein